MRIVAVMLVCLGLSGCFRTYYANFSPQNPNLSRAAPAVTHSSSGWRHFFLFGLLPSKLTIDATQECGGFENIASIATRQTFAEGLVQGLTTVYYINICAPWNAVVHCSVSLTPAPTQAPAAPVP